MLKEARSLPRGVLPLCFIKALSSSAYGIFFSSLTLYFTQVLSYSPMRSNQLVALFLTYNFIMQLLGSLIGGVQLVTARFSYSAPY